jgi:enamine deaminase RidA (YjgF/YER057c/UK114 family)
MASPESLRCASAEHTIFAVDRTTDGRMRLWQIRAIGMALALLAASEGVRTMQDGREAGSARPQAPARVVVEAGGLLYVSALTATTDNGRGADGDVHAQTRHSLDRLKAALEGAGSSLAQAVTVNVYLRYAGDFDAMNAVYREYFSERPPTRTTVVAHPPDGALIAISAVAVPNGAPREVLHPDGWMKSPRPYSYIVRTSDFVFLSGLVSRRGRDDAVVPGWVREQTRTILDNAGTLLKTAGVSYQNVVAARVFVTQGSFFEEMNEEYRTYFPTAPPARATVVAGLMGSETFVEITLVATTGEKQVVGPSIASSLPISAAVRAGRRVFLSGVLGNTETNLRDVAAQTRETLARVKNNLALAGLTPADVVDATVYLAEPWQRHLVEPVYRGFFPNDPPARTLVGTDLVQRSALIEVLVTAYK